MATAGPGEELATPIANAGRQIAETDGLLASGVHEIDLDFLPDGVGAGAKTTTLRRAIRRVHTDRTCEDGVRMKRVRGWPWPFRGHRGDLRDRRRRSRGRVFRDAKDGARVGVARPTGVVLARRSAGHPRPGRGLDPLLRHVHARLTAEAATVQSSSSSSRTVIGTCARGAIADARTFRGSTGSPLTGSEWPGTPTQRGRSTATVLVKKMPACPQVLEGRVSVCDRATLSKARVTLTPEALLDNEPWAPGEQMVKAPAWPLVDHMYSVRLLLIAVPFDVAPEQ